MIRLFDQEAGRGYIRVTDMSSPRLLSAAAVQNISSSISKTASTLVAEMEQKELKSNICKKSYSIVSVMPNWNKINAQCAVMFSYPPIKDLKLVMPPAYSSDSVLGLATHGKTGLCCKDSLQIKMAPQPFAEGTSRIARHGMILTATSWEPVVLKEFKLCGTGVHTLHRYLQQIEASSVASILAEEYNTCKPEHCAPIHFIKSYVVEFAVHRTFSLFGVPPSNHLYCMEKALPAEATFVKYTNNVRNVK